MEGPEYLGRAVQKLSRHWQNISDYYKHITTLTLGAILFISAFLKNDKLDHFQAVFIALSIIAFLVAMVFSLNVMKQTGNLMEYYSNIQALSERAADLASKAQKDDGDLIVRLAKQVDDIIKKIDEMAELLAKHIKITEISFKFGVGFAVCYIIVSIINFTLIVGARNTFIR